MSRRIMMGVLSVVMLSAAVCTTTVAAAETKSTDPEQQLPAPDKKPPVTDKPVKVFILMGQSNMVGFGRIAPETTKGTLACLTKKEKKYPHLLDDTGNWTVRNDVWCVKTTVGQKQDWLKPGFGARAALSGRNCSLVTSWDMSTTRWSSSSKPPRGIAAWGGTSCHRTARDSRSTAGHMPGIRTHLLHGLKVSQRSR